MAADPTPEELRREATENDDFTFLYVRRNRSGRWVRDAKFIRDCGDLGVATTLFADHVAGVDVQVCAVLRGMVRTVDDFEFADEPDPFTEPYASRLLKLGSPMDGDRHTVFGAWDTGDGPRRYSRRITASSAEHAELLVRERLTGGVFLVAAVVEGWATVADLDATWATVDGQQPAAEPDRPRRRWLPVAVIAAALTVVAAVVAAAVGAAS